ncbi:MAG: hypothetical protein HGA75_03625 [Thiobacillus sp.]|nr:hypothetical protein [Thiobacillus sp.]
MSIHFYSMLKAWRRARHDPKHHPAEPHTPRIVTEPRAEAANAAVFAAGIACAGQVGERNR